MPLVVHGCLPLRHPLALRPPTAAGGLGVRSSLALSRLPGLYPCTPWRTIPAPHLLADGPPASITVTASRGGAGPACSLRPSCGCRVGVHLGCSVRGAFHIVHVVFAAVRGCPRGCSTPISLREPPLGSCPGMCLSLGAHACVLCAYVSPRVDLCVRLCTWVWFPVTLFCCPPAVFDSGRTRTVEHLLLLHGSARLLACFCLP
jgi:hypothetical protein